jgi:RHS repeat-associated protein
MVDVPDPIAPCLPARRLRSGRVRYAAVLAALALIAELLVPVRAAAAPPGPLNPASLNSDRMINGHNVAARAVTEPDRGPRFMPRAPVWPSATTTDVLLADARAGIRANGSDIAGGSPGVGARVPVRAKDSPVWIDTTPKTLGGDAAAARAPEQVRVQVFDHATATRAGIDATLIRLTRADGEAAAGTAAVSIDYSAFVGAYGGGWADRLRLLVMPACVLTDPSAVQCRQGTPVSTTNNLAGSTVSAKLDVTPGGVVVALDAASSGGSGSTSATSLQSSVAWSAGANTGEFTWSYPMRTPPSLGGPSPALNLSYSSGSVDARTPAENAQPSWIGEGFEFGPGGFIERKFPACASDMGAGANNSAQTGDLCWLTRDGAVAENLTMSLGGHGGELIRDAANPNRWHPRTNDGSLVERRTGGPNGDDNGEYWVVATTDGTQYWFGGRAGSNATFTVPVYGNHAGEPCRATTFAASSCAQAYRWNLDYVVDPHGNTMTYTYVPETNSYASAGDPNSLKSYVRGGYLSAIEYGTRVGGTGSAPMRVDFAAADRCLASCWSGVNPVEANWPDTPWDQRCVSAPCDDPSPAFYTSKRLSQVTTKVWNATTSAYDNVEQWTLQHGYPAPGDGTRAGLFLERVSHVGLVGAPTSVPDVVFEGAAMPNRVMPSGGDGRPAMNWQRLKTITTEAGGVIAVNYAPANCTSSSLPNPAALYDNHLRCFPARWTSPGTGVATTEFFHKYVVSAVTTTDPTGGATQVMTAYEYLGDPAWHYTDDDGLIATADKTWSVWRGYPTVRSTVGDPDDGNTIKTRSEATYFRGMHGDHLPSGTRTEVLPAVDMNGDGDTTDPADAPAANDEDAFAGLSRRTVTLLGVGGAEVSSSVSQPWQSAPVATRTINGVTAGSRYVGTAATSSRTALDTDSGRRAAGWRTSSSVTTFDSFGMAVSTEDRGDDALADDQTCRTVEYARDASVVAAPDATRWLMAYPRRVRDFAVDCATATAPSASLTEADIIGDSLTLYDNLAYGAPPVRGDVTETRVLKAWTAATQTPSYLTTSTGSFDVYGRITEARDVRGNRSTNTYVPATGGPVTGLTVTNHLGWQTTTTFQPAWGEPIATTDPNIRITSREYDGLGRLTKVWQPGRPTTQSASTIYTYNLRNDAPSSVTTEAINGGAGYMITFQLFDAMLRPRQTQSSNVAGAGRMVSDVFYDSAGRPSLSNSPYWASGSAGTALFVPSEADPDDVPQSTKTLFDGAGRAIAAITLSNGNELWRTVTSYTGDRKDTTPPEGGTAYSTVSDSHGRTTELRTYHGAAPTGAYDSTRYTFNRKGQQTRVEDPAGNHWDSGYDLRGRQVSSADPDKGTSTSTYNDFDDLLTTTDSRGEVLALTYDSLGRKTTLRDDSATGPKRAEWTYEGLNNSRGLLTKSTRWNGTEAWSTEIAGLTISYQPSTVKYTIPTSTGYPGVGGTYSYNFTYNSDNSPAAMFYPDIDGSGGLPTEQLTYGYNGYGAPTTLRTNLINTTYVAGTTYTGYGEVDTITLQNNDGPRAYVQYGYEYGTHRVSQVTTSRDSAPTTVSNVSYTYDDAGNTKKIKDSAATPSADIQCLAYDNLRRLTQAWTPAVDDCAAAPTAATLGGPSKYWTTWSFNTLGNRTQQVEHATSAGDRTTTYNYASPASHLLTGMSAVDASGTRSASYGYDVAGNTASRPGASSTSNQNLTWDAEGHLASVADGAATTSFLYDADGNRLVRRDATGTTLYLPGQELRFTAASATKATTRYYMYAGKAVAMLTTAGLVWLSSDEHGTATVTIGENSPQTASVRRETPYGAPRDTVGTWPAAMDKGFVGGTNDPTGLVHLGAREYDPGIGRFISADPVVDFADPQQMNGYAYASNNPTSMADATGLRVYDDSKDTVCGAACAAAVAGQELEKAKQDKEEAEKVKKKSIKDIIIEAGVSFLLDMFGITDIWNCISKGDVGACVNVLISALPIGKIFSAAKAVWKGIDRVMTAYKSWRRLVNVAEELYKRADDAISAAQAHFDELLSFVDRKTPDLPRRDRPGAEPGSGGVPGDSCLHSFDPDTRVLMADGSTKAIKDLKVGDEVAATDPTTGKRTTRRITQLHVNVDTDLTDVTVVAADGTRTALKTTQHHPFWDETSGRWVHAGELEAGHVLRTSDGTQVLVGAVYNHAGREVMRDLTVADLHTYYVVADATPVLVHNCKGGTDKNGEVCDCNDDPIKDGRASQHADETNAALVDSFDDAADYTDGLAESARAGRPAPMPTPQNDARTGVPSIGPRPVPNAVATDLDSPSLAAAVFMVALGLALKRKGRLR